jgi:serine/threonine-protein kinase
MSMTVRIGSRYVARAAIGHGSFGTVFRADGPDGTVAVKLLRPELAGNPEVVDRFLRERSVLQRLTHPGIVPVRELVAEAGVLALVMDLIDGPDLRAVLVNQGALPPVDAARLVSDVAAALSHAHAQGVVHRDIKPENVLLAGGKPLLTDFGVARLVSTAATISGQAEVLGTPAYLAPELATGEVATPAVDVYACGVLLYEVVTGRPPFVAEHPLSVVHQHVTEQPQRPVGMPEELWRVIAACLAKPPAQRPDADTLRVLLDEWAARPGPQHTELLPRAGSAAGAPGPVSDGGETRAVPVLSAPQSRTQVISTARARIAPPAPATPDEAEWPSLTALPRRNWLLYAAALVAVAAVFFAAGFWVDELVSGGKPDAKPSAPGKPKPSGKPKPQTRYLSELPLVQVANGWGPVELDRAIGDTAPDDGGPLVLGDTTYRHGLGAHAPSQVRVHPPQGCTQFAAVIGIDASSEGPDGGTVIFQVLADGQVRYDSGMVTRQDQPKPIQVDISGAASVDLVVADGGDGNHWDISDWADAELVCSA